MKYCLLIAVFASVVALGLAEDGTVKWFNESKGYGFITRDSGGDIFVHYSDIVGEGFRTLTEGQRVTFGVGSGAKGQTATNVEAI